MTRIVCVKMWIDQYIESMCMLVRQLDVGDCGMCVVGKMAKDVGTAIRKSIVVSFLPCFATFLRFHPYMLLHFF